MNTPIEQQTLGYYVSKLRQFVPKEAIAPATYKLIPMSIHIILIFANLMIIHRYEENWWIKIGLSIIIGISYACVFLYCHELTHGTIVKKQPYRYMCELFFWSFSGMSPTLWENIHNYSHHNSMNTYKDPDRKSFKSEKGFLSGLYNVFIYPNRVLKYSFTVGFAMIFYTSKHTLAVFYPSSSKPSIVTYRPPYTRRQQVKIFFECLFVLLIQTIIFFVVGWKSYLVVTAISWFVYSTGLITFIVTQHLRNPVYQETADPLLTTTSVIVPKWIDKLIDWHSFHVEHHVFPGINFDYYPEISKKIEEQFPDRYERMKFWKAVKESFQNDIFLDDPLT